MGAKEKVSIANKYVNESREKFVESDGVIGDYGKEVIYGHFRKFNPLTSKG